MSSTSVFDAGPTLYKCKNGIQMFFVYWACVRRVVLKSRIPTALESNMMPDIYNHRHVGSWLDISQLNNFALLNNFVLQSNFVYGSRYPIVPAVGNVDWSSRETTFD